VWDSAWERPEFQRNTSDSDPLSLIASPHEVVEMESLSMRLYLSTA
jgi:hypothetical protein